MTDTATKLLSERQQEFCKGASAPEFVAFAMVSIQQRQDAVRQARARLGWSTTRAAAEAMKKIRLAGVELNVSQQSVSDFENSSNRKRIPAWLQFLEAALEIGPAAAAPVSAPLDELEALMLAVIAKQGSEPTQPHELAKILAGAARDYFGRDPTRPTTKHNRSPKGRAARPATAQPRGPSS